ncbi:MAG: outer membrane beta-barrel family protein, partial [Ginsengibacter sp.]
GHGNSAATWEDNQNTVDSSSTTTLGYFTTLKNKGISINFHKAFSKTCEWNIDADALGYKNGGTSLFENIDAASASTQTYLGNMPGTLHILSAKSDFSNTINDRISYEAGWKSSHINTDNLAAYTYSDGSAFTDDLEKSNHFLYRETNHSLYSTATIKNDKWSMDAGLRLEFTKYTGHQLGNAVIKDTVFSKKYSSLFPNVMLNYTIDSLNQLSLNLDRRIDRPPYQKLNPFVFILNKYTHQIGNPSFLPQFTWSATLSHSYKGILVSDISYSITSNYFSQLFYSNPDGLVIYTEGNVGSAADVGASVSLQINLFKWWNIATAISADNKTIKGEVVYPIHANIFQATLNINNQFHFAKNWSAEISGYYNSKSQVDIQEVLEPAGQVAMGVSKLLLKNKLSVKLGARDIFHTQVLKGLTQFQLSNEYFRETRDTRMVTMSLSYHFGKAFKTNHHSERAAEEEIKRSENGC